MAEPTAPPPSYGEAQRQGGPPPSSFPPPGTQNYQQSYPPPGGYPQGYGYSQPPQAAPVQQGGYNQPPQAAPVQQGYQTYPTGDAEIGQVFNASSFSDKAVRNQFIKKVYLILMCQLLITAALVAVFVLVIPVKKWVRANLWFYILAYVTFLVTYIVLACCPAVRRKYPGNYIALGVFTLMFSYVCAAIASYHDAQAVLIAAGITAAVTLSISLFAIQTKIDFTMCHGLMFAAAMTLIFAGFAFIIVSFAIPYNSDYVRNQYILQCVYGSIAALILALFLVFDTQRIVGGKNRRYQLSPEEHIIGAMELYLDIVYLFLIILSFFGGGNND